jgi:interferon, gamma-inducible protein 30
MESDRSGDIKKAALTCSKKLNITTDKIDNCMNSKLGNDLQHQNAVLTDALVPKHQYVPWVFLE